MSIFLSLDLLLVIPDATLLVLVVEDSLGLFDCVVSDGEDVVTLLGKSVEHVLSLRNGKDTIK